ncbi:MULTISPECIES: general stress protein [unclassified Paenibacillus]|uniref:general stress protein n=1 Tax=unclassified Paenibacillus TaxID=185978 RepID=UPI00038F9ADA|nr:MULTISPECIES: general stress protein [unclassified Paenibacillus]KKC47578.1 hypothetical protein VE23_11220 [Paenibacillus sp. D9]CDN44594.1 Putative uncharacterized protein [Paenibacillus sp. P22]
MSKTIAVFDNQENAVKAVQALRSGGFAPDEIKVLGRDRDSIRFIESDTDVHADELQDIKEARRNDSGAYPLDRTGFVVGAAPFGGNTISSGGAPFFAGGYVLADDVIGGDTPFESIFKELGLSESLAEKARDAVAEGGIVLIADREDGSDSVYEADGPSQDTLAGAEAIFRSNGATTILT